MTKNKNESPLEVGDVVYHDYHCRQKKGIVIKIDRFYYRIYWFNSADYGWFVKEHINKVG